MGYDLIWRVVKNIPWAKVVQSTPLIVELVARAKDRLKSPTGEEQLEHLTLLADQVQALEKEKARLATEVKEKSAQLELLSNQLRQVTARAATLTVIAAVSAVVAVSALLALALR